VRGPARARSLDGWAVHLDRRGTHAAPARSVAAWEVPAGPGHAHRRGEGAAPGARARAAGRLRRPGRALHEPEVPAGTPPGRGRAPARGDRGPEPARGRGRERTAPAL